MLLLLIDEDCPRNRRKIKLLNLQCPVPLKLCIKKKQEKTAAIANGFVYDEKDKFPLLALCHLQ